MKRTLVLVLATALATAGAAAQSKAPEPKSQGSLSADQVIAGWKATPQGLAKKMLAKYGEPQEITTSRLIWHNNGPWKYSELVNEEIPHDFPVPHKDMLYQAISYKVDPDEADELLQYDGSIILERTKGEIAARCDKEEANFLAINLADDVANGRRSVDDARKFYAESMMAMMKENKKNEYLQGFRFQVAKADQGDRDKPFGPVATTGRDKK
ncbi:MAG: hypothetical protein H0U02_05505 [Rubrobacter sp.]|nr:hypothetical protein [Rubrobacter sp.]